MSTFIQDYKDWRAKLAQFRRCNKEKNRYAWQIEGLISLEDFKAYAKSVLGESKEGGLPAQAGACFFRVDVKDGLSGLTIFISRKYRCQQNRSDGTFVESCCAGCPHFGELIKYQTLVADVAIARKNEDAARRKLISRFRLSKTK